MATEQRSAIGKVAAWFREHRAGIVVWCASGLIAAMGVFPPWVGYGEYVRSDAALSCEVSLGYHWITSSPESLTQRNDSYRMMTVQLTGRLDWSRLLLQWLIVAFIAGGLLFSFTRKSSGRVAKEIRANRFVLVDESGRTRALLDEQESGPGLRLFDEQGKRRAVLAVDKNGLRLGLLDEHGVPLVALRGDKGGEMALYDDNGKKRFVLFAGKEGPLLCFLDEQDKERFMLFMSEDGPAMTMADKEGKYRVGMAVGKEGPGVEVLDGKGEIIWQTPLRK